MYVNDEEWRKLVRASYQRYDPVTTPAVVEGLLRRGLTIRGVAKALKVDPRTLKSWLAKYPELKEVVRNTSKAVSFEAERSLFKLARGYDYEEVTTEIIREPDKELPDGRVVPGKVKSIKVKKVTKHVPPNLAAIKIVLYKYDPDFWGDLKDIATQVNTQVNVAAEMPKIVLGEPPEKVKNKRVVIAEHSVKTSDSEE